MLSLLMLDYNWDEIIVIKQERALNKLCANLGISKVNSITINSFFVNLLALINQCLARSIGSCHPQ